MPTDYPHVRLIGAPVPAGFARLRIRSKGDPYETVISVVDADGRELELLGAVAAEWSYRGGELTQATVRVNESDIDVETEDVAITPERPDEIKRSVTDWGNEELERKR